MCLEVGRGTMAGKKKKKKNSLSTFQLVIERKIGTLKESRGYQIERQSQ